MKKIDAYEYTDDAGNGVLVTGWKGGKGVLIAITDAGGTTTHYLTKKGADTINDMLEAVLEKMEVKS